MLHDSPVHAFDAAPFIAIWECTRACALACQHCRAAADDSHHPDELTTAEGKALINRFADAGTKVLVLSGGDPLQRDDLDALLAHAVSRGLRVGTIPAATPRLTRERLVSLKASGVHQVALSLDAADAAAHDGFRGVEGCFAKTIEAAQWLRELGVPLQINTAFARWNLEHFDRLAELVDHLGIVFWEVFFLVPTGRGAEMERLNSEEYRTLFAKLHALQQRVDWVVKITEAPHYRMYVAEAERARAQEGAGERTRHLLARELGPGGSIGQAPHGVNSGKGHLFVSYIGEIQPSGFLPLCCGNIRTDDVIEVYRSHPAFVALRDRSRLGGRCGPCEYRDLCGGSRARAFALSGDLLAEDPDCWYQG
jgi:radical SAM protein